MTATMRAVVLEAPGPPEALRIREVPVPEPRPGWVLIRVKAFGINRSELHTRLGLAQGVTFPRVLGIEATGVVAAAPGREFEEGQQVAAMMGGMGRTVDGGYAEFTSVPASQVIPFRSELDWATLGAIPEMVQTGHGSLTVGLDAQPGQTLLIRGGTSSVGMATAILAKDRGLTVLSTTRQPDRVAALKAIGVDHVLLDDGDVAARARAIVPDGVQAAIELVGTNTLPDTLRATSPDARLRLPEPKRLAVVLHCTIMLPPDCLRPQLMRPLPNRPDRAVSRRLQRHDPGPHRLLHISGALTQMRGRHVQPHQ